MSDKSNHIREQIDIGGCVDESTDKSDHKTSKSETLFPSIRCLQLNWKLHVYLDASLFLRNFGRTSLADDVKIPFATRRIVESFVKRSD